MSTALVNSTQPGNCYVDPRAVGFQLSQLASCKPRFFCPNTTVNDLRTVPVICPATSQCISDRLAGKPCDAQGNYEPTVCPRGYYCPDFKTIKTCPSGFFCPVGSLTPLECPALSHCPEGSLNKVYYGPIIFCVIIDLFLFGLIQLFKWRWSKKSRNGVSDIAMNDPEKNVHDEVDETSSGKQLIEGYRNAFNLKSGDQFPHIHIKFTDLGLQLKDGKTVLAGVTGEIKPGKITAIMGPSGAGKTTFMNVLMGKAEKTSGSIQVNDQDARMSHYRKVIGHVPQEDLMIRELSVYETIKYSASIRLPVDWTNAMIEDHVQNCIKVLGLDHVQHSVIGNEYTRGISGGQRKRVNIGMELAAAPLAIFLDEPTSGLDSTSALGVVKTLKSIADLGVVVVSVIHQPRYEIFKEFDDILLIVPGGRTAYIGPCNLSVIYFQSIGYVFEDNQNPADLFMDILSGRGKNQKSSLSPSELAEHWLSHGQNWLKTISSKDDNNTITKSSTLSKSSKGNEVISSISVETIDRKTTPFYHQALLSHNRSLIQQARQSASLAWEIGIAAFAGLIIGASILNVKGELFRGIYVKPYSALSPAPLVFLLPMTGMLWALSVGGAGAPPAVRTFGDERLVYWRESAAGHSRLGYYLGKILSVNYRFIISSLHFSAIVVVLGTPVTGFGQFYLYSLMLFYSVYGLSFIVSSLVRKEDAALIATMMTIFAGVFNGFGPQYAQLKKANIHFIFWFMYSYWITEAFFSSETEHVKEVFDIAETQKSFGFTLERVDMDIGMAFTIGTIFRIIAYLLMRYTHRDRQQ